MKLSFKYKFIIAFIAIEVFFISLILFFNFTSLNNLSKSLIEEKIQTGSKLFTELIKTPMLISDLATLDDAVQSLLSVKNIVGIKITDKQERVISHLHSDHIIEEDDFIQMKDKKISQIQIGERTFQLVLLPIFVEEEQVGNAKITFEITESLKTIQENKKFTFFLVLLEIFFSSIMAYVIGYKLTKALSLLTASAKEVAENDQAHFVDVGSSDDEIAILSKALHCMQQKITQKISEQNKNDQTIRALLNSPLDSIILIDTQENILEINEVAAERFGYSVEELKGQKIFDYFSEEISLSRREHFIDVIFKKQPIVFEENYNDTTFKNHLYPILGGDGNVIQISIFSHDVTISRKAQRELERYIKLVEELSVTDQLTGVYNRRYFDNIFESELNRAKRDAKIFCFLTFDVDHFKKYNDTYGHQMGDEVLITIGKLMQKHVQRAGDFAFRLGGEEFGVIYSVNSEDDIYIFATMLCNTIENEQMEHQQNSASTFVTASFGVVYVNFAKDSSLITDQRTLYKIADDVLYEAKKSGRNRVVIREFIAQDSHAMACEDFETQFV